MFIVKGLILKRKMFVHGSGKSLLPKLNLLYVFQFEFDHLLLLLINPQSSRSIILKNPTTSKMAIVVGKVQTLAAKIHKASALNENAINLKYQSKPNPLSVVDGDLVKLNDNIRYSMTFYLLSFLLDLLGSISKLNTQF